eukprot:5980092-Prymnesium_polylepis.1
MQYEVQRDEGSASLQSQIAKLDNLIKLLPSSLRVSSSAVGAAHLVNAVKAEQTAALEMKLTKAMAGATVGPLLDVVHGAELYGDNRADMLALLKDANLGGSVSGIFGNARQREMERRAIGRRER